MNETRALHGGSRTTILEVEIKSSCGIEREHVRGEIRVKSLRRGQKSQKSLIIRTNVLDYLIIKIIQILLLKIIVCIYN